MADATFGNQLSEQNGAIPIIFAKKLALAFGVKGMAVTDNLTNENWAGELKEAGDRVRIVIPEVPADSAIAMGANAEVCPTFQAVSPEALDLVVDKKATFGLQISDTQKAQTQFKDWLAGQANAYGQKVNYLRNKEIADYILKYKAPEEGDADYNASYTAANHPIAGTYGTVDTAYTGKVDATNIFQFLLQIKEDLINSGACGMDGTYTFQPLEEEAREERVVLCVPTRMHSLILSSYRVGGRSVEMADVVVKDGAVARVAGMDIVIDKSLDEIKDTAGQTLKAAGKMAFIAGTKNAVTRVQQVNKVESTRDPYCFRDLIKSLTLYGYKMVHPECIVRGVLNRPTFDQFNAVVPVEIENGEDNPVITQELPTEAPEGPGT